MKIIKAGVANSLSAPWWVGLTVTCPSCTGEFALEQSDEQALTICSERCMGGRQWVVATCPTLGCDTEISVDRVGRPS